MQGHRALATSRSGSRTGARAPGRALARLCRTAEEGTAMNTAPKVRRRAIRHRTRAVFVALVLVALATSCYSPQGSFESALVVTGGTGSVRVIGWAADRDSADPVQIQVTIDGAAAGSFAANGARPD